MPENIESKFIKWFAEDLDAEDKEVLSKVGHARAGFVAGYRAAQQQRALDKVPVRLGDPCSQCGGCDVQCAECLAALCQ